MHQKAYPLQVQIRFPQILNNTSNDLDFIYSTFVKSLNNQYPFRCKKIIDADDAKKIVRDGVDKNWFTSSCHANCTRLLRNCNILVACDPSDHDQVFGYIIYNNNPDVLYWIYCKYDFRNTGVATRLMQGAFEGFKKQPIEYAIKTSSIRHLVEKWKLKFNSHNLTGLGRVTDEN